jgi:hypothetical protein
MFGPRGCWAEPGGPLIVADTGNHRVLIWRELPRADATLPDLVLGQPDFSSDGRNRGGAPGPNTLHVPTGVLLWRGCLVLADSWNHRVLIWREVPLHAATPADLVLGQRSMEAGELNRGGIPAPDSFYWPYGLATDGQRLYVADSNNRRVLIWNDLPQTDGQPADLVLGQASFTMGEENAGGTPNASSMRWPHGIATDGTRLLLADAGNNRVLVWNQLPRTANAPADLVLGQPNFGAVSDNQGYHLGQATLRFPYAVALWQGKIMVADTGNSRIMCWENSPATGDPAAEVFGQVDFNQNGENRWKLSGRDTLCWPYGISSVGGVLAVADSGNNRVLLWHATEAADG